MTNVGHMRNPPFAQLPDIHKIFEKRHLRFEKLAKTSPIKDYVEFLKFFTKAQQDVADNFRNANFPTIDTERAHSFKMPPIERSALIHLPLFKEVMRSFLERLNKAPLQTGSRMALENTLTNENNWSLWASHIIEQKIPDDTIAQHIFVTGALQIILTLATQKLDTKKLQAFEHNLCPACGGTHSASMIVGWPSAEGARFCSCLYCGTLWHYVRIKCTFCVQTKGIGYKEIEGGPGSILAETCDECGDYCKQMNHQKDSSFDVFADDIGSIALDMLMKNNNSFKRGAFNPFLIGY